MSKYTLDAVGLAANQCNLDGERFMLRVFAFKDTLFQPQPFWRLIINPIITEYIGMKEIRAEGCLTWKGKLIVAERYRAIEVNYYNEVGEPVRGEMYTGFDAQVFQHEINHLNGIEERVEEYDYINKIPKRKDVGRNDPCPCKSGKKYKHCCLLYL